MAYRTPSHDKINRPGDEGSCPPMPTEEINGKSFPNGDNDSVPMLGAISIHGNTDQGMRSHAGSGANPKEAMPGA